MKRYFLISFFLVANIALFAQVNNDTVKNNQDPINRDLIQILKTSKEIIYTKDGIVLGRKDFEKIFLKNAVASKEFSISKTESYISAGFVFGGSCFLLVGLISFIDYDNKLGETTLLSSNAPIYNPSPLYIGIAAIAVSLPFAIVSKVHFQQSIDIYNNAVSRQTSRNIKIDLGLNTNGLSLRYTF